MEFYFKDTFTTYGSYDFPLIRRQEIALADLKLIRFSNIVKDEHKDLDATVHFPRVMSVSMRYGRIQTRIPARLHNTDRCFHPTSVSM
jgi:hypothetical protein